VKTASTLAKITTHTRVVEFMALTSGEIPVKVLLVIWWHKNYAAYHARARQERKKKNYD